MASYQEIDTRLEGVENALMFLMRTIKISRSVGSPLGLAPIVETVDLFQVYREALANGIQPINQVNPSAPSEPNEEVNGQLDSSGQ